MESSLFNPFAPSERDPLSPPGDLSLEWGTRVQSGSLGRKSQLMRRGYKQNDG